MGHNWHTTLEKKKKTQDESRLQVEEDIHYMKHE
jgi:hypothetical protein